MSKEVTVISGKMRQQFDEAAKRQIVEQSYASSLSLNKFAKQQGISPATLCIWRKQLKPSNDCTYEAVSNNVVGYEDLRSENQKLRLEIQNLKQENFNMKAYLGHTLYELNAPKLRA